MWKRASGFRMPAGAEILGTQGDVTRMQVTIPPDEQGFHGRQCPACEAVFRVDSDDYAALPDDCELWCVYCGHHADHGDFVTQQQQERLVRAARELGLQMVRNGLEDAFRRTARRRPAPRGRTFGIDISYRSAPYRPQPLPDINEERLIRVRTCGGCALRYAVFGEHRFCPVCGQLPAEVVALDALGADTARLDCLAQLPADTAAPLREQGVFTRMWVDTLENLVTVVETLAAAVFQDAVADSAAKLKGKGNIFQRLDDTAELFAAAGYPDLRSTLDPAIWQRLVEIWAARHVFTHTDGLVDAKYLAKVPASQVRIGQRLTITETICRQAIADTEALCRAITSLTTP